MNGSRARSHPAETAVRCGERVRGPESGLTVTAARCHGAPRGGGVSAPAAGKQSVRLLLLLLRTSTGREAALCASTRTLQGHAGAGQTDHCLSRMRPPPVLGPLRQKARAGHVVQQHSDTLARAPSLFHCFINNRSTNTISFLFILLVNVIFYHHHKMN